MPEALRVGMVGEVSVPVTEKNIAESFGNKGARVFATPFLVGLMEQAAIAAVASAMQPGEGTVGTKVDMSHLAATPVGMNVKARAELVEIAGKRLIFNIEAFDEVERVGECRHERFLLKDMAALQAKADRKKA